MAFIPVPAPPGVILPVNIGVFLGLLAGAVGELPVAALLPAISVPEAMFFFPGQQTSQRAPLSSGSIMPANRPFDGGTPQQHRPPAERMRSTYSGYPEHEFANFEADAFARRDASRPAANPSPYGVLVPRKASPAVGQQRPVYIQQKPPRSGGMSRPSQQQPSQRMRAGGPKARFPQNFPTHQPPRMPPAPRVIGVPPRAHADDFAASVPPSGYGGGNGVDYSAEQRWDWQPGPTHGSAGRSAAAGAYAHHSHPPEVLQVRPGEGIGDETAAGGGAADDEMMAAMAELEQLQGMATGDVRDQWRFATASRPSTAPGGGSGQRHAAAVAGGGGPAAAAALAGGLGGAGAGGSPVRSTETEAELRLRLATAESVMRKLYRKTNDLQERLTEGRPQSAFAGGGGGGGGGDGDGSPRGSGKGAGDAGGSLELAEGSAEREQALYLLQQKEADLQKMREYTAQMAARLEHLTEEQQRGQARPQTAADHRNDEYRERYMRMRGEYRQLLRSRTDSVRRSGRLAQEQEHGVLINQLDEALKEEAELHRKESQRLNEELYLQEKKSCDWYVEKRLLQDRLQALENEIGQEGSAISSKARSMARCSRSFRASRRSRTRMCASSRPMRGCAKRLGSMKGPTNETFG